MTSMRFTNRLLFVLVGSLLSAVGLELFLVPHKMIVGGVTGVSAIFSYLTEMRLGLFLFLLNLPFVLLRYRKFDSQTRLMTLMGLAVLSLSAFFLHPAPALMDHTLASAAAGGIALGIGIGMVLRYGGFIDSADGVAMLSKASPARTLKIMWLVNGAILLSGGFVFGWDEAMYSIVAFLLAYRMADFAMSGFSMTRMVWIKSEHGEEIRQALRSKFGKEVVFLNDGPSDGQQDGRLILCTVSRLEQARVMRDIKALDPNCSMAFHAIHR
ncbi:YitT family protein [Cohnella boryungensis]|uniref:YitT family protein n=1 Tax=Cohnella boryungensis TaxID=768479 RepID=A0ABV8SBG7_9BACL